MKSLLIYVHGKGGNAGEADHYKLIFDGDVVGLDYTAKTPWEAKTEFPQFFDKISAGYDKVTLVANSIGAYFCMCSLADKSIDKALFISPIVDMEKLIYKLMHWAGVSEESLAKDGEITTDFGETLSWQYLCYVKDNPIKWNIPTYILYGEKDNLTELDTISSFSKGINARLTVMEGGEHWFHTEEQMKFLDDWFCLVQD